MIGLLVTNFKESNVCVPDFSSNEIVHLKVFLVVSSLF